MKQTRKAGAAWVSLDNIGNPMVKKQFTFVASSVSVAKERACLEVFKETLLQDIVCLVSLERNT